jgi:ATP-dependent DNA ligase
MLAEAGRAWHRDGMLPGHLVPEQKPDGFRCILFARRGLVLVQSRQGADLTPAFPDIAAAATAMSESLVLDGELVVPHEGKPHFTEL